MSKKNSDLVAPMMSHLHTVMRLEQSMGGFQYDWKAHREMCAAGASTWARRYPWQLLTCVPETSGCTDLFDPLPQRTMAEHRSNATQIKNKQSTMQTKQGNPHLKQGGVCRLYNRAPAGCHMGRHVSLSTDALNVDTRIMGRTAH